MFLLFRPDTAMIEGFLAHQSTLGYSYRPTGVSQSAESPLYTVDRNRAQLGFGRQAFGRAKEAIRQWKMFDVGWIDLCWPAAPIEPGASVAILIQSYGLFLLCACRIVYVVEETGPVERFGFAYGTLPGHVERGEERFVVEWRHDDDTVSYDLSAFSQPNHPLTWLGYPLTRRAQKRFARDSLAAMVRASRP